jgi:rare lipoprotein A
MRKWRRGQLAAGALILGVPATAAGLAGQAIADSAAQPAPSPLPAAVKSHHLGFGRNVVVSGTAPASQVGQTLILEFAPAGASTWRGLTSTRVAASGHYRLAAPLRQSGLVKVVGLSATAASPRATSGLVASNNATSSSSAQSVTVAADFRVRNRTIGVLGGASAHVRGKLLPGVAGRRVVLQGRAGGRWHTLASARTGARGGFDLRYSVGGTGLQQLRVRFGGDRLNARAGSRAGQLAVYRQSVASWYSDGGATACGFHAYYGVANRSLPCGTKVSFRSGGRTVTAVVDDRGPFVGGREWDLNQNTAAALGFGGVGTVWSSA